MKEKIRECLEIIQYNPEKHKNLKSCLFDILNKDEYDKIMRGIITDSELLKEVRDILAAYEFLKEHEEEMLSVINDINVTAGDNIEQLDEVFIYYDEDDGFYHVMKKNQETGNYDEIQTSKRISVEDNFYTIYIDSQKLLCNLQGETLKILNSDQRIIKQDIFKITDQIIMLKRTSQKEHSNNFENQICYIKLKKTKNGKFKQLINPDKNIKRILNSKQVSDINKNHIFDLVFSGKKIKYGKKKNKQLEIINNYVYTINENGEISYFTLDGKQILSTDKDNYFYIGRLVPNDINKRNIVVVGKYDKNLKKIYNYYDLDKQKELFKQNFSVAYNWMNYGAIVHTPKLSIITENGKILPCNSEKIFPIIDSPIHDGKQMIARSIKKWQKNTYIVEFVPYNKNNFHDFGYDDDYYGDDNIYYKDDKNMCEQVSYGRYSYKKVYALIKDVYTSPERISEYFLEYRMSDDKNDKLYIIPALYKDQSRFNFRILDILGNETDIIRKTASNKKRIDTVVAKSEENSSNLLLNNSAFLLPDYSEFQKNELITLKKEIISSQCSNNAEDTKKDFSYSWFEGRYPEILIRQIKYIGKNNAVIVEVNDCKRYAYDRFRQDYNVAVNQFGKPIYFDKAMPISMDILGNIIMSVPYGDGQRYILVNSNGEILINFAEEIVPNNNGLYIVSRNDKHQLYNSNGIAVAVPTDKQEWVKKYYINSCGVIRDVQERLLITNSGYKYLVDDEGDITIKENKEYSKVLQKIMYLDKNTYEEGE